MRVRTYLAWLVGALLPVVGALDGAVPIAVELLPLVFAHLRLPHLVHSALFLELIE